MAIMSTNPKNLILFINRRIFCILMLFPCGVFSQGISNMWLSGYRSGFQGFGGSNINFYSGFPDTNYVYRQMNINDCHANISDSLGNLLFYTNGIYIANSNNDTMLNGSGLNPGPYTTQHLTDGLTLKQGNLILPQPENANLYYLFHETFFFDSLGFLGYYCSSDYLC